VMMRSLAGGEVQLALVPDLQALQIHDPDIFLSPLPNLALFESDLHGAKCNIGIAGAA